MIRRLLSVFGALAVLLGLSQPVATAAPAQSDKICVYDALCNSYTSFTITWHNRTASLGGDVVQKNMASGHTTAKFEAFAGSKLIDRQTRTTGNGSKGYGFAIGDPNLPGGINRIVIDVCWHKSATEKTCSKPHEYRRP